MAWTAPRTWISGELVTAALMNTHVRDNETELRAGGTALASQAANDFLYASTATQLARLAAVSGKVPRYNGSAWEMIHPNELAYPVGSVYEAVVSTNPATLLGVGTWVAFGTGRVTVGIDAGQAEFDTVEETGGAKTHTLTTAELAVHTHIQDGHGHSYTPENFMAGAGATSGSAAGIKADRPDTTGGNSTTGSAATVNSNTATNQNAGSGNAHNNLQPYIVTYRWKRTA